MILHGYYRSSATYRVRIALALKGMEAVQTYHHLGRGEHRSPDYLALNPQGRVPALETDTGEVLTQSLAIIEWLEETCPSPALLPGDGVQRAHIRAFSQVIACDIQPLQNTGPLNRLRTLGADEAAVTEWIRAAMRDGFSACEALIARTGGVFCFGDTPTLADVCLVPQLYNARRHSLDLTPFARLVAADAACARLDAFRSAAPEAQPDAE